jgi:hypothetical protein
MASRGSLVLAPLLALALSFLTRNSWAESTTCRDGSLAVTGDRTDQVLANCGRPSWSRVYVSSSRLRWSLRVDEWVYDLGDGTFPRFLRFENGILVEIRELSRGR